MSIVRQAMEPYAKGSNNRLAGFFLIVGLATAGITAIYFYAFARHHLDNLALRYLISIFLLALGGIFIILTIRAKDDYAKIGLVALAVFLIFGAVISFVVTLILLAI